MLTKDEVREILIKHGFKIYEGLDDLKPYVYIAAYALIDAYIEKENKVATKGLIAANEDSIN